MPSGMWKDLWHQIAYIVCSLTSLFLFSYRYWGRNHVPRTGPFLVIANHESYLDPPYIGLAVGRRLTYMARKSLFGNPLFNFLLDRMGTFPVDQEGSGLDGIKIALALIKQGEGVVIFPEGTRSADGTLGPFQPGLALLLRRSKVPVLPVGIAGFYKTWSQHEKLPKLAPLFGATRPYSLGVVIGELVRPEQYAGMKTEELLDFFHRQVAELRAQAEHRRRQDRDSQRPKDIFP